MTSRSSRAVIAAVLLVLLGVGLVSACACSSESRRAGSCEGCCSPAVSAAFVATRACCIASPVAPAGATVFPASTAAHVAAPPVAPLTHVAVTAPALARPVVPVLSRSSDPPTILRV